MITISNRPVRSVLGILLPFVAIPAWILLGAPVFDNKRYMLISFGVVILALLFFLTGFETRTTGSRRMVIVAVMTALCIVGRFLPFFKPVTALTILTAMYFGKESGFLVGALAALLSNIYFGQGPWTPFQMLAWGLIGLIAGYLSPLLRSRRILLLICGALSGIAYSALMDVWTVLWYNGHFNAGLYLTALVTALPHTVLYAVSNVLFLWWLAKPLGTKLERIRIKYGV